jgi:hypothetical protein
MKAPLLLVVMVTVVLEAGVEVGEGLGLGVGVGVSLGFAVWVDPVKVGEAVGEELSMTVVGELTAVVGVTPGFGLFVMPSQAVTSSSDANNRR